MTLRRSFLLFSLLISGAAACSDTIVVGDGPLATPAPAPEPAGSPGTTLGPPSSSPAQPPSWTWLAPKPMGNALRAVYALPGGEAWAVGEHGTVLRRSKGVWEAHRNAGAFRTLQTVWASGPNDVWFGGIEATGKSVLIHDDGKSFQEGFALDRSSGVLSLWGAAPDQVWAVTTAAGVKRWDGHVWSSEAELREVAGVEMHGVGGPAGLAELWGPSGSGQLFGVGPRGRIYRRDPLRGLWRAESDELMLNPNGTGSHDPLDPFCEDNDYVGVWGAGPNDVWAVFENAPAKKLGFSHYDGQGWQVAQLVDPPRGLVAQAPKRTGRRIWGDGTGTVVAYAGSAELTLVEGQWRMARVVAEDSERLVGLGGTPATGLLLAGREGLLRWRPERLSANLPTLPPYFPPNSGLERGLAPHVERLQPDTAVNWHAGAIDEKGRPWFVGSEADRYDPDIGFYPVRPVLARVDTHAVTREALPPMSQASGMAAAGDGHLWVTGIGTYKATKQASVLAERRGGAWKVQTSTVALHGAWSPGGDEAWVVGEGAVFRVVAGVMSRVDNGSLEGISLWSVSGSGRSDVWMAGVDNKSGCVLLHWDGVTLSELADVGRKCDSPWKVWVAARNDVWLTGAPGWHYDGKWTPVQPAGDTAVTAVSGRGPKDVWLVTNAQWDFGQGRPFEGFTLRHYDGSRFDSAGPTVTSRLLTLGGARGTWAFGVLGAVLELAPGTGVVP